MVLAEKERILLVKSVIERWVTFKVVNFEERWIDITPFEESESTWDKYFAKSYRPINEIECRFSIMRLFEKKL